MKKNYLRKILVLFFVVVLSACQSGKVEPTVPPAGTMPSAESAQPTAVSVEPQPQAVEDIIYAPSGKDDLIVGRRAEPTALDPHTSNQVTNYLLMNMVYDRLVYMTNNGEIEPMLAESWEWVDDTTLRMRLRDDVKFHNGEKFTAEDVVYSIQRACEMPVSAATFTNFDGPNTKVIDEHTVEIKFKSPTATALTILSHGRGNIVNKALMEEIGSDLYGRSPVGTGKFKFVDWISGDRLTFTRNDDYWGELPAYKDFVFRVIPETATRAIELETGAIDFAMELGTNDIDRLSSNEDLRILITPSSQVTLFQITTLNFDILDDVRVREAMHTALNMEAIVKTAYLGKADVAKSILPPTAFGYFETGPQKYDPERAKQLIQESGFDTSQVITLTIVSGDVTATSVAEMAQNMWKAVGLNVEIVTVDRATMTSNNNNAQNLLCITQTTSIGGNPENGLLMWERPTNGYHNDQRIYDDLAAAKGMMDDDARRTAYHKILQYLWDTHLVIPIANPDAIYGAAAYLENVPISPDNMTDFSLITFTPAP